MYGSFIEVNLLEAIFKNSVINLKHSSLAISNIISKFTGYSLISYNNLAYDSCSFLAYFKVLVSFS